MYSNLTNFLDRLSNPPSNIGQFIKAEKYVVRRKGYGTPELEMKFMHKIFLYIQTSHPGFESFSWQQCNEFNDNYHHFQLNYFTINNILNVNSDIDFSFEYFDDDDDDWISYISFDPLESPDQEEIEYAKENNIKMDGYGLDQPYRDDYWEYRKNKYQYLEVPCLKFIVFLKLLEINFSMYYLLYTFGNGVEVIFSKEGVTVTKIDENDLEGSPLGEGMDLDE